MNSNDPSTAPKSTSFTGVVLAGGHSRRMGSDKALIRVAGKTRLETQAQLLVKAGAGEVLISCRPDQPYGGFGYSLVFDEYQDRGPIGGIHSALTHARYPLVCILAVDLPRMTSDYLSLLLSQCQSGFGVVPRRGNYYEPLAAFYPRTASKLALDRIAGGNYSLQSWIEACEKQQFLSTIPVRDAEAPFFHNANQPDTGV